MVGPGRHLASLRHCHKAKYQSQLIPKDDMEYLFQLLFPESQILCVENKHKSLNECLSG